MPEITSPPAGVIRSRSEPTAAHARVIRMKTEPEDGDREEERGGVREEDMRRDTGEEQKEISARMKRSNAEHCLENMTETDV